MNSQSERRQRGQQRGGGRRGVGDGQEDVSLQWVTLLGQKPGLLGVGVTSLPSGYIFSISATHMEQQPLSLTVITELVKHRKPNPGAELGKIRQVKRWAESGIASSRRRRFAPEKAACQVSVLHGRNESQQIADGASAAVKHQLLRYKGKALLAPAPAV